MNRAHIKRSSRVNKYCKKNTNNYSIDLIYGILHNFKRLEKEPDIALDFNPPHISAYVLTVEKKTALDFLVKEKNRPFR